MAKIPRWFKIPLLMLLVAILAVLTVGFVYEQVGRAHDARNLPPRIGRAVNVNGRSMNLYCSGEGTPTVIFESGGDEPGYSWLPVQPKVAQFTRACWYDRAGIGWSDPPPQPRTSASITGDLHELLRAAGEKPPYVLVGASVGGEYVRVFAARFPAEVAGMVLVDSSHPDQHEPAFMLGPMNRMSSTERRLICAATPLAVRFGLLRFLLPRSRQSSATPGFTAEEARILNTLEDQPRSVAAAGEQSCAATRGGAVIEEGGTGNPEVDGAARRAGILDDRPLVVLTAGRYFAPDDPLMAKEAANFHDVWVHQLQASLARLSTRGRQIVVENAGHVIEYDAPDRVVDAVRDVVQ